MILDIIKYDDNYNKLRILNIDVIKENKKLQILIDNMFETLDYYGVYGLSAPQVGYNLNLFIIKYKDFKEVFINPDISLEGFNIEIKESCLSFPNMEFAVNRYDKIQIKFFDRDWIYRYSIFNDKLATIIQHEYDHLKCKLIID